MTDAPDRSRWLPAGTVTLIVCALDGSGPEADGSGAVLEAKSRWTALVEGVISEHGGAVLGEAGRPAAVAGAFSRASDALEAGIAVQRELHAASWPDGMRSAARAALHTAEARMGEEAYHLDQALARCAHLAAAARLGQVLLSGVTAALVIDRLPASTALVDLGHHRLRDLGRPEHVWQVAHPGLRSSYPPLQSLDRFPHNLPFQLTALVGRDREITEVSGLLAHERLVTLTGSAGVGKSRLALAVAAGVAPTRPAGVWWVELAPVADADAVGRAALTAAGARGTVGTTAGRQLAVELGDRTSLVVLDNCEHVIEACTAFAVDLLSANPVAAVLATSREPLGLPGEVTWRVPSMAFPGPAEAVDRIRLADYDAAVLLVDRARRARPSFVVTDANAPAVAQICRRLDGVPLAIELAAARCRQFSVESIAEELDDRFRLLTGGARTAVARQQTLAASIDWSHDRLDEPERITFRRLGVFAGPFPLAAAEAVVAEPGDVVAAEVFDLVGRLVDKSMVSVDDGVAGEPLYRLLETLRAYALDRASNAGELGELRAAHARWWAGWVEQRGAVPTDSVLAEVEAFHANLKSALDWSVDEAEVGLRLLAGVARPWQDLGRAQEAMPAAERLLADEHALHHPSAWLEAAWRSRWLYFEAQDPDALRAMTARVGAVAEHVGDEYYRALGHLQPGVMNGWSDALQLAHGRGDRFEEGLLALIIAGNTADDEPAAAMPAILEAERLLAALGVRSLELGVSVTRGDVWAATGPLDSAIELARTIVTGPFSSVWREGVRLLSYAGLMARDQDALALAVELVGRAEQRAPGPADWIDNVRRRAALLSGEPSAIHPDLLEPDVWPPTNGMLWLASREAIDAGAAGDAVSFARRMALPTSHAQAALAAIEAAASGDEGRWHDALTVAMGQGLRLIAVDALEGLAATAAGTESWVEALRLLGAAERLRDETGYRWRFRFEQAAVDDARATATMALGESAATAEAEGRALEWREAAAYARRARGERGRPQHGWASLTPTETQVVALVAEGLTNPEIAERLLMGRATVKTHLAHVFTKLGVHTRAELAAAVVRHAS